MSKREQTTVKKEKDVITVTGIVVEALPNAMFRVKLANDTILLCTIAGKLRIKKIRILPDDKVDVEMSPYDMTRGRIAWRYK